MSLNNCGLDKTVIQYSKRFEIPIEKLKAIIAINTGWDPNYFKRVGRGVDFLVGLTGLAFSIARDFGFNQSVRILKDVEINLNYCCEHLTALIKRYDNDWDYVYAGFNLGVGFRKDTGEFLNEKIINKYKKAEAKYVKKEGFINV